MRSYAVYGETWEKHDGRIVMIDGINHKIQVNVWRARFPREEKVISVYADVCDKNSAYYLEKKAILRDDWSVDILDSEVEVESDILSQLEAN